MSDPRFLLAAATTDASPDMLRQIPGTLERGVTDIEKLPLFAHLSAVMPAADMFYGGAMLVIIVLVHAAGVRAVTTHVMRRTEIIMQHPALWRADLLMGSIVFMLLLLHVLEMFFWSAALVYSDLVPDWRTAGFFAGNTYTTVGYGNFVLPLGWHMLAPIIAMSGLFTFGWSGSVLVDFVRRINALRDAAVAARSPAKGASQALDCCMGRAPARQHRGRGTMRVAAMIAWTLAAAVVAASACAAEIRQTILQKGIYTFPDHTRGICAAELQGCPEKAKTFAGDSFWGSYFGAVCLAKNKDKCVCSADVVYPVLVGDEKSQALNRALKKIAEGYACAEGMAITKLSYEVVFDMGPVFSVLFDGYGRGTGGQGSCHSQSMAMTANRSTGKVYRLEDVLARKDEAAIRNSIVDYVTTYFIRQPGPEDVGSLKDQVKRMLGEKLWSLGFYLRDRQLFVELNETLLGCAQGPSFAVPIPPGYITDMDILSVLGIQ